MRKWKEIIGPGLLMAAAAVGVSHLVQSTRAGASFGFELISVIVVINLLKYPFFEYGHRFYAVTGRTLLDGYLSMGKPFLIGFLGLNFITAMASVAGVTFVTGALVQNLLPIDIGLTAWCGLILLACASILGLGQYKGLDLFIKILMVILVITTLISVTISISNFESLRIGSSETAFQFQYLPFLLALMGWMPAPIELSVWQSLWMEAAEKERQSKITLEEAKLDFNFGYITTLVLAIAFCLLGATVMYGVDAEFSSNPAAFASQVVDLYTENLGEWSRLIISLAAFATMFSTTITLIDAYPRSLAEGFSLVIGQVGSDKTWLRLWVAINSIVALVIIWFFRHHLKSMVDLVTIMAFLAGPFFAYLNLRLIQSQQVPEGAKPPRWMIGLSWLGIAAMLALSIVFVAQRFLS